MVSFAAQVGTGPLALHYFHLFPVWFLLTNMIVIPLASVILYLAMATIFIPIQLFYGLTGFLLSLSLKLLATSVEFIESLPASVITSIYLSGWETLLVYALSLSLYQLLCLRSKKMLLLSLVLMITFLAMQNIGLWNAESQKQIYVYDISGHTVIELYERRSSITMYNQDEVPVSAIEYTVLPNRIAHKIKESKTVRLYNERVESECGFMTVKGFVLFAGRRIFIAEENFREADSARCDMDIVVITGNFKYEAGGLVKQFSPELLIIDSSVPYWRQKEIEDECLGLGIRSYSVRQNGCYIEEI
jgi:competence protein ComEC